MSWIPPQKMNKCPNPRCRSKKVPPHVDAYKPGSNWYAGWCPSCGIWGPKSLSKEGAVTWWNLSFPEELTSEKVSEIVKKEIAGFKDKNLIAPLKELLVTPYCEMREWAYGEPGTRYPCWVILEHHPSVRGIVYCEQGFGPKKPWGLAWLDEEDGEGHMGDDSAWFPNLEWIFKEEFFEYEESD